MNTSPPIDPLLQPVIQIFIRELKSHLVYFQNLVNEIEKKNPSSSALTEIINILVHRFHQIKGGAGFLQLEELKQFAKETEDFLKNQNDIALIKEKLKEATTFLKQQHQMLTDQSQS